MRKRGSVEEEASSSSFFVSSTSPIATPATRAASGTPASSMAKHPPHTDAMDDEPLDSVMVDSTRTVYGNASVGGTAGASARSASVPCPISRLPGAPTRPVSPTEHGGKKYCR